MKSFSFTSQYKSKKTNARIGTIHTPHGDIQTPAFVPVGTQASVKSLTPEEVQTVGTQLFFVNTYHMAMRPGIDTVEHLGGLHAMMKWNHPLITDSGGFQVFSLGAKHDSRSTAKDSTDEQGSLVKITEDGVTFRSHWDGNYHTFTPELSMEYQWKLGSDIHIAFDDCTPYPVTHEEAKKSMERTHRWAARSVEAHNTWRTKSVYQALYGSVQGSVFEDLRRESATYISSLETDGIAIGGVAVGETKEEMKQVLDWVIPILPEDKPKHLLGVGEIPDIFMLVEQGIDTFDCVQPTRLARVGNVYVHQDEKRTQQFTIDIQKSVYSDDTRPIDPQCLCYTCQTFTRAYVHHLFKVRELLAYRLATIHNLTFIHTLVNSIRMSIGEETLQELKQQWLDI